MAVTDATIDPEAPYARDGLPTRGFRNYWYPVLKARKLGRRPRAVTVLGERIVLFRDGRPGPCARGSLPASRHPAVGRRLQIPRQRHDQLRLSWLDLPRRRHLGGGADGGPERAERAQGADPSLPGRRARRADLAVRRRHGTRWRSRTTWPDWIHDQGRFFQISYVDHYRCNWRALVDNWTNDHHAAFVHGYAPELIFQPHLPFAQTLEPQALGDGRGMTFPGRDGIRAAEFPRARPLSATDLAPLHEADRARRLARSPDPEGARRLPGQGPVSDALAGRGADRPGARRIHAGAMGGAGRRRDTRCCSTSIASAATAGCARSMTARTTACGAAGRTTSCSRARTGASLERMVPGEERLSRTDAGMIAWRKFAGANARTPNAGATRLRAAGD